MDEQTRKLIEKLELEGSDFNRLVQALKEANKFDSVFLIATRAEPLSGTAVISAGCGNTYANKAVVEEWLNQRVNYLGYIRPATDEPETPTN